MLLFLIFYLVPTTRFQSADRECQLLKRHVAEKSSEIENLKNSMQDLERSLEKYANKNQQKTEEIRNSRKEHSKIIDQSCKLQATLRELARNNVDLEDEKRQIGEEAQRWKRKYKTQKAQNLLVQGVSNRYVEFRDAFYFCGRGNYKNGRIQVVHRILEPTFAKNYLFTNDQKFKKLSTCRLFEAKWDMAKSQSTIDTKTPKIYNKT